MAGTEEGDLVEAARRGDERAFGQLFDRWFDRVHDLSRRIVRDSEVAAEVAQDAFLSAWTRLDTLDDVDAFGGWLLRIARNASLNRLDKERRSVAFDDDAMTTLTDLDPDDPDPIARLDRAEQVDLVWAAAAALGPRDLSVLDLHLRHGLGAAELAEELGTNRNNVHQILHALRGRLATNVRAIVLWRAGRPACPDLRTLLATGGTGHFDKRTVKIIDRHAAGCDDCGRERTDRLAPAALFGAAPVVAAPMLLRAQAAEGLEAAGVSMSGSTALGGPPPSPVDEHGAGSARNGGPRDGGRPGPASTSPSGDWTDALAMAGGGSDANPAVAEDEESDGPVHRRRLLAVLAVVGLFLISGTAAWVAAADEDPQRDVDVVDRTVRAPTSTAGPTSTADATTSSAVPSATEAPTTTPAATDAPPVVVDPTDPETEDPGRDPTTTTTSEATRGQDGTTTSTTVWVPPVLPPIVIPPLIYETTTTTQQGPF